MDKVHIVVLFYILFGALLTVLHRALITREVQRSPAATDGLVGCVIDNHHIYRDECIPTDSGGQCQMRVRNRGKRSRYRSDQTGEQGLPKRRSRPLLSLVPVNGKMFKSMSARFWHQRSLFFTRYSRPLWSKLYSGAQYEPLTYSAFSSSPR